MILLAGKRTLSDINFGKNRAHPRRHPHRQVTIIVHRDEGVGRAWFIQIIVNGQTQASVWLPVFDTRTHAREVADLLATYYRNQRNTHVALDLSGKH